MYWLGFFVTLIILGTAALVFLKLGDESFSADNTPAYILLAVIIIVLASIWPVTWIGVLCCAAIYILYTFISKRIEKFTKGKEPDV